MTKEIFMDITKANLIAEYVNRTKEYVKGDEFLPYSSFSLFQFIAQREEDWDHRLKDLMVRRIQNMAHLWFGRKQREKFAWKGEQKRVNERSGMKQTLVTFLSRKVRGFRARNRFE